MNIPEVAWLLGLRLLLRLREVQGGVGSDNGLSNKPPKLIILTATYSINQTINNDIKPNKSYVVTQQPNYFHLKMSVRIVLVGEAAPMKSPCPPELTPTTFFNKKKHRLTENVA